MTARKPPVKALVKPLVIGVAGGTGSGKTTVAQAVYEAVGEAHALILPQDAYYRAQDHLPEAVRSLTNYDEPEAFEHALLTAHIDALLRSQSIERPVYDFSRDNRAAERVVLEPRSVVIVEGILVLHDPELRERLDLAVFVDAPPDERFIRRLERDVRERGRDAEGVIAQYRKTVKPMHDLFVEPSKRYADLIVPRGGKNALAIGVLQAWAAQFVARLGEGHGAGALGS